MEEIDRVCSDRDILEQKRLIAELRDRYSNFKPPKYIDFWLTKAPIVFLAISAFAFIIGLNLFPYSSQQVWFLR